MVTQSNDSKESVAQLRTILTKILRRTPTVDNVSTQALLVHNFLTETVGGFQTGNRFGKSDNYLTPKTNGTNTQISVSQVTKLKDALHYHINKTQERGFSFLPMLTASDEATATIAAQYTEELGEDIPSELSALNHWVSFTFHKEGDKTVISFFSSLPGYSWVADKARSLLEDKPNIEVRKPDHAESLQNDSVSCAEYCSIFMYFMELYQTGRPFSHTQNTHDKLLAQLIGMERAEELTRQLREKTIAPISAIALLQEYCPNWEEALRDLELLTNLTAYIANNAYPVNEQITEDIVNYYDNNDNDCELMTRDDAIERARREGCMLVKVNSNEFKALRNPPEAVDVVGGLKELADLCDFSGLAEYADDPATQRLLFSLLISSLGLSIHYSLMTAVGIGGTALSAKELLDRDHTSGNIHVQIDEALQPVCGR